MGWFNKKVVSPLPPEPTPIATKIAPNRFKVDFQRAKPSVTPTLIATPTPAPNEYQAAIEEGFKNWGSPPAATLSAEYAKAPASAKIFEKYPFLLAAQSLAETSGGAKQKFKNNPQNWGIVPQAKGDYNPETPAQVINDAMTGIGGTRTLQTHTPTQVNTQNYYKKFRETGDLMDFARTYAPPGENDTEKYARDLQTIMDVFQSKMKKK